MKDNEMNQGICTRYFVLARLVEAMDSLGIKLWWDFWADAKDLPSVGDVHEYLGKYL